MRIAVVSPFVDRRHGTERAVAELVERLAADPENEVYLYAQRVENVRGVDGGMDGAVDGGAKRNIHWQKIANLPGPQLATFVFWLLASRARMTWDRARGIRMDAVFSPGVNTFSADVILVHAVFQRIRELHSQRAGRNLRDVHRSLYYRLIASLERRFYRRPEVSLAAVSSRTARQLSEYFARQDVAVVPNGVDNQYFSPAERAARRDAARRERGYAKNAVGLLVVGNDLQNKGLPVLLDALREMREVDWRLEIVSGDDKAIVAERIEAPPLKGRVLYRSEVKDLREVYAAANIYVAASLEDSFNLPALEAMASGLAVVVSTSAGVCENVRDRENGIVLQNPTDAAELASILRSLAADPPLREQLGRKAIATAAQLTWDRHAEAIQRLLLQVAERRRGRVKQA